VTFIKHDIVIIQKGIVFNTMEAMKTWLVEYVVFCHHPFIVEHSDENKHYIVICHHGCPWIVHARKTTADSWGITRVIQPYTCSRFEITQV
jgi:hypothetical protein